MYSKQLKQPGFTRIEMVIALVILVVLGGVGYVGLRDRTNPITPDTSSSSDTIDTNATGATNTTPSTIDQTADSFDSSSPTAHWKTYTNGLYKFSFKYPREYTIDKNTTNQSPATIFLSYPTDGLVSHGITVKATSGTLKDAMIPIESNPGYTKINSKKFGGLAWVSYQYDGKKDPKVADKDPVSVIFLAENKGVVYTIIADQSPAKGLTADQIESNLDNFITNTKFN